MAKLVSPWWVMVGYATERGWTASTTARGRLRLSKPGAVVFGPPQDAADADCRAATARLIEADLFLAGGALEVAGHA
jgi:hypothetical protein